MDPIQYSSDNLIENTECPISGLPIKKFPQWQNISLTENYSVTFLLIGKNIILTIPNGSSDIEGMKKFIDLRKEFLLFTELYKKKHVELKDYSHISRKIDKESRLLFTDMMLKEKERGYLLALLGFNGSTIVRCTFELARKLYSSPIPVILLKTYNIAITKAIDLINGNTPEFEITKTTPEEDKINKLLLFINELSWNLEDNKIPEIDLEDSNPFKKLYQSLAIIKTDYSAIIENHKKIENKLQKSYEEVERKVNERTALLKENESTLQRKGNMLETSLDILSHDTKNHFISLKYEVGQITDGQLKISVSESIDEIQELIMEATGIMSSKKRIISLVELIEKIKVTSKRIPLMEHDRIKVEFISPEFLFIQTSSLLKNAVSNLIENALKYTGQNNSIRIKIEKNDDINIHIIDFGEGIPDDEKEKILDKFYRRKSNLNIDGSGRGLWITNSIIQQEGGTLTISDNPDGGTIFTIKIAPYVVDDFNYMLSELSNWFEMPMDIIKNKAETYRTLYQLQQRDDIDDMDSAVFTTILTEIRKEKKEKKKAFVIARLENLKNKNPEGKSIIIVDDSLYVQYYLAKYFSELGFNVIDYQANGESGSISYKKRNPDYISLDNNMHLMTGPEAAEEIYGYDENAKIIFISAMGNSLVFKKELKDRFPKKNYKIMTKPIYKKDIIKTFKEY